MQCRLCSSVCSISIALRFYYLPYPTLPYPTLPYPTLPIGRTDQHLWLFPRKLSGSPPARPIDDQIRSQVREGDVFLSYLNSSSSKSRPKVPSPFPSADARCCESEMMMRAWRRGGEGRRGEARRVLQQPLFALETLKSHCRVLTVRQAVSTHHDIGCFDWTTSCWALSGSQSGKESGIAAAGSTDCHGPSNLSSLSSLSSLPNRLFAFRRHY